MALFAPLGTMVLSTQPPEMLKQVLGLFFIATATMQVLHKLDCRSLGGL
jgi:uncharacterized membrane protein YfcA